LAGGIVAALLGVSACGSSEAASEQAKEVTIGVLTPLSKPGDPPSGQQFLLGANLAAEWVNGRIQSGAWDSKCALPGKVNLAQFDDQGTPATGIAGLRKLAFDDHAVAVVGQIHSAVMKALGPISEQLKVPTVAGTASDTAISSAHLDYTFQAHAITADRAKAVGGFIVENLDKFKRIAIVAENSDYGVGNVRDLKALLESQNELTVKDWIFDAQTKDLSPLLLQVKSVTPDLVFNVSSTASELLMVKQAQDVGLLATSTMVVSDDRPVRQEFWDAVGAAGNHIAFVTYYTPSQKLTEAGAWFKAEYVKKTGEQPIYTAFQGFGNTIIAAQAINKACSVEGPAVAAALRAGGFVSWNVDGVGFPQADGADWQRIKMPIVICQYTAANQNYGDATILYPSNLKTGTVITPTK
jgi:branched-chain amino acid transport system substrate-binding protein